MNRARNVFRMVAVVALVAAAVAVGNIWSNGGGGVGNSILAQSPAEAEEAQVRVAAQRLSNGRVELAVQVESQGQWMPRVLPETRWLSKSSRVDRWISSASVKLSSGHEVRISARRLASGEVEVGLQESLNGERQERQLPEDRLLPADQEVGEWWTSSPLTLPERLSEPTHVPLLRDWTWVNSSLTYHTHFDHNGTITTWTGTQPTTGGEWATADFAGVLRIGCYTSDNFTIEIQGIAPLEADSVAVTLTIDDLSFPVQDWDVWTHYEDDEAVNSNLGSPDSRRLLRLLRGAKMLSAEIEGFEGTRTWDLSQTLTTPVQANLEHCGNYVEGYIDPPPPPNYVPLVNVDRWLGNVRYRSSLDDDGQAWTNIDTYPETGDIFLRIGVWSSGEHFNVLLDQLPPLDAEQVSVVWSVDDGNSVEEEWRVHTFEGSHSYIEPHHPEQLFKQLSGASSFTFEVEDADTGSVTVDLSHTFSTPLQLNIDERRSYVEGQSREPVYEYVPITNASGRESGTLEWFAQTEDGGITTNVVRTVGVKGAEGGRLRLTLGCWQGRDMDVKMDGLPVPDEEADRADVTLRIDDGEAFTQNWHLGVYGSAVVFADADARLYEQLRGTSSVTIEVADSGLGPVTFDLTGMFDTPVQENIDMCGMYNPHGHPRPLEYDYVPVIVDPGSIAAGVDYGSQLNDDGTVYTFVVHAFQDDSGTHMRFSLSCGTSSSGLQTSLGGLPLFEGDSVDLVIVIDDGEPMEASWNYYGSEQFTSAWPNDPQGLIEMLRDASAITFEASEHGFGPVTFNVARFFDTPVQENFDNCGKWKRGETRQLGQPASPVVSGQMDSADGETKIQWSQGPVGGTIPSIWTRQLLFDEDLKVYLIAGCSESGATSLFGGTRFGDLSADEVGVVWSVDGGAEQRDTWAVVQLSGSGFAHPESTLSLLTAWRNGSTLDITFETAPDYTHRVDLTELFGTPIQAALDECLALPQPTLAAPAGSVTRTVVDQLTYTSGATSGSAVAATSLSLRLPSDDAPAWAGYSSRFETHCGTSGYRVAIWGLGLDWPVFIQGYSVDVTWSVNGGAESTSTWDVWPWNRDYYAISPQDDAAFYAAIKGADSLTITVASDPEFVETYDLAGNGFWETPVQPNLDACVGS